MKIVVCVKQVVQNEANDFDPAVHSVLREQITLANNPNDLAAVEMGLGLKERYGGSLVLLSMGPRNCLAILKEALSLGGDAAILLSSPCFAGADTMATSYTLAAAVRKIGNVDLVLTGQQSVDGETGQTGPALAEHLNLPYLSGINQVLEVNEAHRWMTVEKLNENGSWRLKAAFPRVLSLSKKMIAHRKPTLKGKLAASRAEVLVWNEADLELDCEKAGWKGSPTKVVQLVKCQAHRKVRLFEFGNEKEAVCDLLGNLIYLPDQGPGGGYPGEGAK